MNNNQSKPAPNHAFFNAGVKSAGLITLLFMTPTIWAQESISPPETLPTVTIDGQSETNKDLGYKAVKTSVGKTNQDPKDIPQAITVVPETLMDDRNATTLKDALRNVAGVTFNAGEGGRIGDNITMRGYSAVGDIYLDNVRDGAQYNRDTFNYTQLDVLKGSSSMLFGKGSTGGVINQVSKTAKGHDFGEVVLVGGSNRYRRLSFDLNKALTDNIAFRLNGMNLDTQSFRNNVDQKSTGIAPTISIGAGTNNEVNISYFHLNTDNTPDYGKPYFAGKPLNIPSDRFYGMSNVEYEKNISDIGTLSYQKTFDNGLIWKTVARAAKYQRDLLATAPRLAANTTSITDQTVINRQRQARGAREKTFALQSDINHQFQTGTINHEILAGVEVLSEKAYRWTNSNSTPNPATTVGGDNNEPILPANFMSSFTRTSPNSYKGRTYSVFAQDTVQIAPHWKLMAGLRHDSTDADYIRTPTATDPNNDYNRSDQEFSWRAGIMYQPNQDSNYYASYSTGFNPSAELYQLDARGSNTPPEKNRNMEIGAKWNVLDDHLALRTSLSRSEKTNERNTDLANPDVYLLTGKRHTDTFELEANGRLTDKWDVFANYAYMRANIDKAAGSSVGNVDKVPFNTPKFTYSLWSTYQLPFHLKVGAGIEGVGDRFANETNTITVPGYTRVDTLAEYPINKHVALKLNIFNLLDKQYDEGVYRGHVTPGTTRTAQLSLTASF